MSETFVGFDDLHGLLIVPFSLFGVSSKLWLLHKLT